LTTLVMGFVHVVCGRPKRDGEEPVKGRSQQRRAHVTQPEG
jgi:hypothetical protein